MYCRRSTVAFASSLFKLHGFVLVNVVIPTNCRQLGNHVIDDLCRSEIITVAYPCLDRTRNGWDVRMLVAIALCTGVTSSDGNRMG